MRKALWLWAVWAFAVGGDCNGQDARCPGESNNGQDVRCPSVGFVSDEETGGLREIEIAGDAAKMNWVHRGDGRDLPWITADYRWGTGTLKVDGKAFGWKRPVRTSGDETVYRPVEGVEVAVRRRRMQDGFEETYAWRNVSSRPVSLSEIDVHTPFRDDYLPRNEMWTRRCFAHVWAGGSSAWVCAMRMGGKAPHLGLAVTAGAVDAYGLKLRDHQMGSSNSRGVIALSPPDVTLGPGASASVSWRLFPFADKKDFFRRVRELGGVSVTVSDWTVTRQEPVDVTFAWKGGKETKRVTYEREGRVVVPFEYGDGKRTFAELNAIADPFEHVLRRARFLVAHQQVNDPTSPYDGAFTQYDMETGRQRRWWEVGGGPNMEPGAERLGIGVSLAVLAQRGYKDEFLPPLRRYADFVLKLCRPDGYVYASLSPKSRRRDFNSPWAAEFFLEMHKLTGEKPYLQKAYELLLSVVLRKGTLIQVESPDAELVKTLRKAGMTAEADKLVAALVGHKDLCLKVAKTKERIEEVNFAPEFATSRILQFLAAYDFAGDKRYLQDALDFVPVFEANLSPQPSAWCHDIGLHHWDGFWFGKRRVWGDTLPNHWNGSGADTFAELARHGVDPDANLQRSRKIARQVLTLIRPDGGAGCAFVYPDRVNGRPAKFLDPLANDQDWVMLYYLRNTAVQADGAPGYSNVESADWSAVRTACVPTGKAQLSTHIPLNLPGSPDLVYADPAFNVWKLPVPAGLKTGDAASEAQIASLTSTVFSAYLGEAPFVPDFRQTVWTRRTGGYPIVTGELEATYRRYTFTSCTHPETGELYVHGRVLNTGNRPLTVAVRLRRAAYREDEGLDYHYIGYDWTAAKATQGRTLAPPECVETDFPQPTVEAAWSRTDDDYRRGPGFWGSPYYVQPAMRLKTGGGVLKFEAQLQPGESRSFTVAAGFAPTSVRHPPFAETCAAAERFWDRHLTVAADFGDARMNDLFRSLQITDLQMLLDPWKGMRPNRLQPCQGGTSERFYVWIWEAMCALGPMTRLGHFEPVRQVLDFILDLQDGGTPPEGDFTSIKGAIGTTGPRWANSTGSALILAAAYLDAAEDGDFYRRHADNLVRAADWILGETAATRRLNADGSKAVGYGMMPGCVATDGDRGIFFTATDSWSALGVRRLAEALGRRGHPAAARLAAGFARYQADIADAIRTSQGPDGIIPRRLGSGGKPSFEFRNIPSGLNFLLSGVFDPRTDEAGLRMLRAWERSHVDRGFFEPFDARIKYIGNYESMSAHAYLQRGEWKRAALARATFINFALTRDLGIASERYSEVDDAFAPWQPNASNTGRGLGLLTDRFLLEGESVTVLLGGFAPYEDAPVSVVGLHTRNGRFSLRRADGKLTAEWERPLAVGTQILVPEHHRFAPEGDALVSAGEGLWRVVKETRRVCGACNGRDARCPRGGGE